MIDAPTDIKSPNASSLGEYGVTPINHYSGKTNIEIPLYNFNEDKIPLNISLTYNSSGIKVNSIASWVGQNWSLNAGGVITRAIRGERDFHNYSFDWNGNAQAYKGFKHTGYRMNSNNWSEFENLKSLVREAKTWDAPNLFRNMDLEPDIFTFNFMGFSGTFFLDNEGKWKVQSNTHLKIEIELREHPDLDRNNSTRSDIGKIVITDLKGNKYIFGNTNTEIEYSFPFVPEHLRRVGSFLLYERKGNEVPNAWYLSKVINVNNVVVYKFDYERGGKQVHFYRDNHYSRGGCYTKYPNNISNPSFHTVINNKTKEHDYKGKIIFPTYLNKITLRGGKEIILNSSLLEKKAILRR